MNYILFDDGARESLKPLTYIRPVCDIRIGVLTIREKWEKYLGEKTSTMTEENYFAYLENRKKTILHKFITALYE